MKPYLLFPALLCGLCAQWVFAEDKTIEFDRSIDFAGFRTFAWMPDLKPIPPLANVDRERLDQTVREAIEEQLRNGPLRPSGSEKAHLYLSYFLSIRYDYSRGLFHRDAGGARAGVNQPGPFPQGAASVKLLRQAELRILFTRGDSEQTVWEGASVESVADLKDLTKIARAQVRNLLDQFPP